MTEKNKFSADYKKEIVKLITDLGKKPVTFTKRLWAGH
jgi:hypothetical protein